MSVDAKAAEALWVFGYGSLVWKPDFPFVQRHHGYIENFARRFWQGSRDHRGTEEKPGRVVTLVPLEGEEHAREREAMDRLQGMRVQLQAPRCYGTVYEVCATERANVLAYLDHREKGGYTHARVTVFMNAAAMDPVSALVYMATPGNEDWLGPAPTPSLAQQIVACTGPSGRNRDYLLELADALQAIQVHGTAAVAEAKAEEAKVNGSEEDQGKGNKALVATGVSALDLCPHVRELANAVRELIALQQ